MSDDRRVVEIGPRLRCLVVDDFDAMRKVTISQLRQLGVENVQYAKDGGEALRLLQSRAFDVVLSDWNMPVMTGIELLQAMRGDESLFSLPFVLITAEAERRKVEEAVAAGVTSLLLKPYTPEQLRSRLAKALLWKPRAPSAVLPEVPEPEAEAVVTRPTILMVDDTPDNLLLLSQLFKGDYRVRLAQSGNKALELMSTGTPPDLVLLDVMMPGMDGFEVARRMREHPATENVPIIFITAMSSADARMQGLSLGAVDFVTKPIDPETLKPRVRNFMRYVQLRKDLQQQVDGMLETAQLREDVARLTQHDIKAPLAGALGLAQGLLGEASGLAPAQREQLRLIEESVLQALRTVNLSSELYRIETGRFELQARPVPVRELLQRSVAAHRAAFASKALDIALATGGEGPCALGDATLCDSIFQNLLKNACEAAPAGSRIGLELREEPTLLRVLIRNEGAMARAIRERFFDKYVTHGKPGGTGLGAYSAKLLTEAQGGRIALQVSDEENSTTLVVSLPRAP